MTRKRTIFAVAAAAVLGTAAISATPQQAQAAWWVAPAIAGGVIVGVGVGAAAAHSPYAYEPAYDTYAYEPDSYAYGYTRGSVYVRPYAACHYETDYFNGRLRRIRVCD